MRKKALVFLALILVVLLVSSVAQAAGVGDIRPDAATGDPGFAGDWGLQSIINFLVKFLKFFAALGGIVVPGAYMFFGYKYALSADPRAKADAAHGLVGATIGGLIAFGAFILAVILKGFVNSV